MKKQQEEKERQKEYLKQQSRKGKELQNENKAGDKSTLSNFTSSRKERVERPTTSDSYLCPPPLDEEKMMKFN